MSQFSEQGLSILLFTSVFKNRELINDQLAKMVNSYNHTKNANGGYVSAEFNLSANPEVVNDWLEDGLMRHVEVYGPTQVWEGFVNEIEIAYGSLMSVRRGPVMEISNRVKVVYQTVSYDTNPPIPSSPGETDYANHSDSQEIYGVLETILSMGETTETLAEQGRDVYLDEMAWPETSPDNISLPASGGGLSITVRCLGYSALLERYVYNQTAVSGYLNASDKVEDILQADPNTLFGNTNLSTNTLQVPAYENDNAPAGGLIKTIADLGDSSDNRWLFGVYNQFEVVYAVAPSTHEYQLRLSSTQASLEDGYGNPIPPWMAQPGKWLLITDLLPIKPVPGSPTRQDPRLVFIESLTYAAPRSLRLTGSKITKARQFLTRMGIN